MSPNSNRFRFAAYVGAGAIFLGLLAFIFLAFPDPAPVELPGAETRPSKKNFQSGSSLRSDRKKMITDRSDAGGGEVVNDSSLAGEVILRGKSKEELAALFTRALESGGDFRGLIRELGAARIQFPTREAAEEFRDSLGDDDATDSNYIVMAPDFPTEEELAGEAPASPGDRSSQNVPSGALQPFGDGALAFLGVTGDMVITGTCE